MSKIGKIGHFFGLDETGELKLGKRADVVVFNLDEVKYRDMESATTFLTWKAPQPGVSPVRLPRCGERSSMA